MTNAAPALPARLAIVDDESDFSETLLSLMAQRQVQARWFADSESLLCTDGAFDFDFYILDLGLPGIDGIDLLKLLRRRTQAGVLVVSGRLAANTFEACVDAGADMYLAKPVSVDQVLLSVRAVYRRTQGAPVALAGRTWRLALASGELFTPDGARVPLSGNDLRLLEALQRADEHTASRADLAQHLGLPEDDPNLLNATIYRLRRRIEDAAAVALPLQARSKRGYQFAAPLVLA